MDSDRLPYKLPTVQDSHYGNTGLLPARVANIKLIIKNGRVFHLNCPQKLRSFSALDAVGCGWWSTTQDSLDTSIQPHQHHQTRSLPIGMLLKRNLRYNPRKSEDKLAQLVARARPLWYWPGSPITGSVTCKTYPCLTNPDANTYHLICVKK